MYIVYLKVISRYFKKLLGGILNYTFHITEGCCIPSFNCLTISRCLMEISYLVLLFLFILLQLVLVCLVYFHLEWKSTYIITYVFQLMRQLLNTIMAHALCIAQFYVLPTP